MRSNYPILYRFLLDISSLVSTCLILYFLDSIFLKLVVPFIEKLIHILKMTGNDSNDAHPSDSNKTPGKKTQYGTQ